MKTKLILANAFIVSAALVAFATPAFAAQLSGQLDIGSTGPDVTALQTFLAQNSAIYPSGLVTGYYGQLTANAVSAWQTANGIDAVGRVGPVTLAALNAAMAGGSSGTVANNDTTSNPALSGSNISTTANSATFTWNTNEPTNSRVLYGTSIPFLFASASSVASTNGLSTSATATVTGLNPGTTYYYSLHSSDASGNESWTIEQPFTTAQ